MASTDERSPARGFQKMSDSMCAAQYAASLKCLDDANYDKSLCQDYFDAYKACRKREHKLRLEQNRASSQESLHKILEKLKF